VTLNRELLQQTIDVISASPERFFMGWWWTDNAFPMGGEDVVRAAFEAGACGTTACIAGTVISLAGATIDRAPWETAQKLLGLNAKRMFRPA
jgi:hypothetical protein